MKRFLVLFIVQLVGLSFVQAQQKHALFLHGYSSNGQVGWLNSGTPQALKSEGVIDYYWVPDLPVFTDISAMTNVLSQQLSHGVGQKWVFVGHSLGGLIARNAENDAYRPLLQKYGIQLKGIITLGTPHQGCPAAVNYPSTPALLQSFSDDVLAGPKFETDHGGIIDYILTMIYNGRPYYQDLSQKMTYAKSQIQTLVDNATGQHADQLAPGSAFINSLQNIPAQVPHVSISGVESSPALVRWAPTLDIFGGSNPPPEDEVVSLFNSAKNAYYYAAEYNRIMRDYFQFCLYFCLWNCDGLRDACQHFDDARKAWKRGYNALNNIDNTWFQIHNEYLSAVGYYDLWIPCYDDDPYGDYRVDQLEMLFEAYDPCRYGASGYFKRYYYTYYYADKSDGYIPKNRTKWRSGEGFTASNADPAQLRQGNINFDGSGEADGGYNHGELRDLTRKYGQHGPSDPMQYGKRWIDLWIKQSN